MNQNEFLDQFQHHQSTLFRLIYRRIHNYHDAQDLVHETYLKAQLALHTFDPQKAPLERWLCIIATRLTIDFIRKYNSRVIPREFEYMLDEPDPRPTVERTAVALADSTTVLNAVLNLPQGQKAAFICRHLAGMSTVETANYLGKSEGAVKLLLFRARKTLISRLGWGQYHDA